MLAYFSGEAGLWALFASSYLSSTLLPGGSEAVLAALATQTSHPPGLLLAGAAVGNTLGGMTSWFMGWLIARRWPARAPGKHHEAAVARLQRWGSPILLLSWLPIIGDPLCLAAGWLRVNPLASALFIAIGKTGRYAVVLWLV